jgi:hypothetical protein
MLVTFLAKQERCCSTRVRYKTLYEVFYNILLTFTLFNLLCTKVNIDELYKLIFIGTKTMYFSYIALIIDSKINVTLCSVAISSFSPSLLGWEASY